MALTDPAKTRVLVADDHPLYRGALETLVGRASDLTLIGAVASFADAEALLATQPCEVVLLDVRMPGMEGLAGVRRVRAGWPDTKVVLISGQLDERIVADGLALGATGFLSKEYSPDTILAAIRLVLTGATYVPPSLVTAPRAAPATERSPPGGDALSERELDVLRQLAEGASHKEIARALGLAEVTVKLHTQRIVRKLHVKNRAAAIALAVSKGIVPPPE